MHPINYGEVSVHVILGVILYWSNDTFMPDYFSRGTGMLKKGSLLSIAYQF